jgi:hypothetical protein
MTFLTSVSQRTRPKFEVSEDSPSRHLVCQDTKFRLTELSHSFEVFSTQAPALTMSHAGEQQADEARGGLVEGAPDEEARFDLDCLGADDHLKALVVLGHSLEAADTGGQAVYGGRESRDARR